VNEARDPHIKRKTIKEEKEKKEKEPRVRDGLID
jgi:hypothetical protein